MLFKRFFLFFTLKSLVMVDGRLVEANMLQNILFSKASWSVQSAAACRGWEWLCLSLTCLHFYAHSSVPPTPGMESMFVLVT